MHRMHLQESAPAMHSLVAARVEGDGPPRNRRASTLAQIGGELLGNASVAALLHQVALARGMVDASARATDRLCADAACDRGGAT